MIVEHARLVAIICKQLFNCKYVVIIWAASSLTISAATAIVDVACRPVAAATTAFKTNRKKKQMLVVGVLPKLQVGTSSSSICNN